MTSASEATPSMEATPASPTKSVPKSPEKASSPAKNQGSPVKPSESDEKAVVNGLMQDGRKAFALAKYQDAADAFSKATETLDKLYGEGDLRTGDAWYHYGKTLLALARSSTDLFGQNAIPKNAEKESGFALPLSNGQEPTKKRGFAFGGDEEIDDPENHLDDSEEEEENDEEEKEGGEPSREEKAFAQGIDAQFEEAWQTLETARVIYAKSSSISDQKRLADIYDLLADLNLENEHFDESVEDYTSALAIRQSVFQSTDRMIAQNCYKLAIAYEYSERILDAMKFYAMAAMTLKSRLKTLEKDEDKDEKEELAQLISEIETKLRDLKQSLTQQTEETKARAAIKSPSAFGSSGFSAPSNASTAANAFDATSSNSASSTAPATNDLSGMIKKKPVANVLPTNALKRKPEEPNADSSKTKEAKIDTTAKNDASNTPKAKALEEQKGQPVTSAKDGGEAKTSSKDDGEANK